MVSPILLYFKAGLSLFLFVYASIPLEAKKKKLRWYRGNTHAHTKWSGHGDSRPEQVAHWYYKHAYDFLCISEHNRLIPSRFILRRWKRARPFLVIPSQEVTELSGYGNRVVHLTGINVSQRVSPTFKKYPAPDRTYKINAYVRKILDAGGIPVLNHPNLSYSLNFKDIRPVRDLLFMEIFNGHPRANSLGDKEHPSVESLWDRLLSAGLRIYGLAVDDAHIFRKKGVAWSNPGRAWIMVQARELKTQAILRAMKRGDFYASTGVILRKVQRKRRRYTVILDTKKTRRNILERIQELPASRRVRIRYRTEFIGMNGRVLRRLRHKVWNSYRPRAKDVYVRVRITAFVTQYRSKNKRDTTKIYAWTQPYFLDTRHRKRNGTITGGPQ